MRREITTFLQRFRAFLQHWERHFCRIQKIILSATRPGSVLRYIPLKTSSPLSDEGEVQCKSNRLYFTTVKNDHYPGAACFVHKFSFCRNISKGRQTGAALVNKSFTYLTVSNNSFYQF